MIRNYASEISWPFQCFASQDHGKNVLNGRIKALTVRFNLFEKISRWIWERWCRINSCIQKSLTPWHQISTEMNKGLLPLARQANVIIAKNDNGKILGHLKKGRTTLGGKKARIFCFVTLALKLIDHIWFIESIIKLETSNKHTSYPSKL